MGQQTTCADGSDSHSSTLDQERTTVRQAPGRFNVFHDLLLRKFRRATKVRLARAMNPTMGPMWVRHESPLRLTDREHRSDIASVPGVRTAPGASSLSHPRWTCWWAPLPSARSPRPGSFRLVAKLERADGAARPTNAVGA